MVDRALFLLTPRWLLLHALTVAAIVAMITLGSWQLGSFDQDQSGQETSASDSADVATTLPPPGQPLPADAVGAAVTATGHYNEAGTLLVPGRVLDGDDGWLVMTPLVTAEGIVPVVRGWVSTPDDPAVAAPEGQTVVQGTLYPPEEATTASAGATDIESGEVRALTTGEIYLSLPRPPGEIVPALLVAESETPTPQAEPVRVPAEMFQTDSEIARWRHLAYGAQWWIFAGAAVVFWGAFVRAGWRARKPPTEHPTERVDEHPAASPTA